MYVYIYIVSPREKGESEKFWKKKIKIGKKIVRYRVVSQWLDGPARVGWSACWWKFDNEYAICIHSRARPRQKINVPIFVSRHRVPGVGEGGVDSPGDRESEQITERDKIMEIIR